MNKKAVITAAVLAAVALTAGLCAGAYNWGRQDIGNLEEIRYRLAQQDEILQAVDERTAMIAKYGCKPLGVNIYGLDKELEEYFKGLGEPLQKGGK